MRLGYEAVFVLPLFIFTLTRAQVYNFNVGDTFDYKIESKDGTLNGQPGITFDLISFQRVIITQAHYFFSTDSFFIVEENYNTPKTDLT